VAWRGTDAAHDLAGPHGHTEKVGTYAHVVTVSVGVDIAEARKGLDVVALDDQRAVIDRIARASVADVVEAIVRIAPDVVCIDSPPAWAQSGKSRTAERALRPLGITAFSTPTDPGDHPFYRWMRVGFDVFNNIEDRYPNYRNGPIRNTALEVFPEASATLLTGTLCPKGQKIPFRRAVLRAHDIDDTLLPSIDAVDAALAALTGLRALEGHFTAIGDPAEGVIVVPVAPMPASPLLRPPMGAASNRSCSEPISGAPTMNAWSGMRTRSAAGTPRSPAKSSYLCGCGCRAPVSRRFLPGHDAKLKSRLLRAARLGDTVAELQLRQLGWIPSEPLSTDPAAPNGSQDA
jgi:predicted nuclease with RNAse H fold